MQNLLETDNHFHFDAKYSLEEYETATKPLKQGRFLIHQNQKGWIYNGKTWGELIVEYWRNLTNKNVILGLELSINRKTTRKKILDLKEYYYETFGEEFDFIYSIHSYKNEEDFLEIFEYNCEECLIDYICHPLHLTKNPQEETIDAFLGIAKKYNVTVEINSRYVNKSQLLLKKIKKYGKYCLSTDAHKPKDILKYREEIFNLFILGE